MAAAERRLTPERLPTNAIGGTSEKETVRPFGVTGALGVQLQSATSHHDHGPAKESQEPA